MLCGCIDIGTNTTRVLVAEARDGRLHGGPAAARVHPPGPRAGARRRRSRPRGSPRPRASSPSSTRWPSKRARSTIRAVATARASGAPPTATSSATRCASTAASRCACSTARRRRGWPSSGATRTLGRPLPGRVAVVDVGGGSTEIAVGTLDRRRRVVGARSRSAPASWPTPTWAATRRRATQLDAVRDARRAMLWPASTPPPVDAAVAVGGSAASLRRLVGDELDDQSLERALQRAHQRSGRRRRGALRPRPAARAADARGPARARRRGARRSAGRCRSARRSTRRCTARPGGRVTTRSRILHCGLR